MSISPVLRGAGAWTVSQPNLRGTSSADDRHFSWRGGARGFSHTPTSRRGPLQPPCGLGVADYSEETGGQMSSTPFSAHSCHLQFYNLSQTGREQRGGGGRLEGRWRCSAVFSSREAGVSVQGVLGAHGRGGQPLRLGDFLKPLVRCSVCVCSVNECWVLSSVNVLSTLGQRLGKGPSYSEALKHSQPHKRFTCEKKTGGGGALWRFKMG